MLFNGKNGYTNKMMEIYELRDNILKNLKEIPEIEVLGCIVFRHVLFEEFRKRETLIDPS